MSKFSLNHHRIQIKKVVSWSLAFQNICNGIIQNYSGYKLYLYYFLNLLCVSLWQRNGRTNGSTKSGGGMLALNGKTFNAEMWSHVSKGLTIFLYIFRTRFGSHDRMEISHIATKHPGTFSNSSQRASRSFNWAVMSQAHNIRKTRTITWCSTSSFPNFTLYQTDRWMEKGRKTKLAATFSLIVTGIYLPR